MCQPDPEAPVLHRPVTVAIAVASLVIAVGACGGGSSGKKAAKTNAGSQTISIQNFKFNPDKLTVKVGDKVSVTNLDAGAPHSLTADDKSFDTGTFNKGDSPKTIALKKAGSFPYHCTVHNFMKGTITVS
jgi:plastocyanin